MGNFHKAHQAFFIHEMLNSNKDTSIIGVNLRSNETRVKLEEQKKFIFKYFDGDGKLKFSTILSKLDTRMKIVVTFLAILDMVREGLCSLQQNKIFGELELQKTATA